jgi:hypothetical protein
MGAWAGMCATGAAKANDGDFDGAKAMCKACHSKYQAAYHSRMRDMAWPLVFCSLVAPFVRIYTTSVDTDCTGCACGRGGLAHRHPSS